MARIARITAGFGLIIVGILLLVVPGPGVLTILGGIALLANEFPWARSIADWAKEKAAFLKKEEERPVEPESDDQIG
ncbi:MAG TPA: PGPGW domain-containing protein [Acidimicrobiia bacterium]